MCQLVDLQIGFCGYCLPIISTNAVQYNGPQELITPSACLFGYIAKKKSPHRKMKGLQKKAAAYSMTARYCKRSEAGTDAGINHAIGVHSMT
ncbi:hypothetical protein, partial [Arenibacter echinorum]|uniref:hypothetical protein n=1 Tax=Arenibacter echinorum TaxID=440515 RepID=UPI001B879187